MFGCDLSGTGEGVTCAVLHTGVHYIDMQLLWSLHFFYIYMLGAKCRFAP